MEETKKVRITSEPEVLFKCQPYVDMHPCERFDAAIYDGWTYCSDNDIFYK